MAPEMLEGKGYDFRVDFWSVGCILFEFLSGYPPFSAPSVEEVWMNVTKWETTLERPVYTGQDSEFNMSDTAWSLIAGLLVHRERRLGTTSIGQIKSHRFFDNLRWEGLRDMTSPFVPQLNSDIDTAYFDDFSKPDVAEMYRAAKNKKVPPVFRLFLECSI